MPCHVRCRPGVSFNIMKYAALNHNSSVISGSFSKYKFCFSGGFKHDYKLIEIPLHFKKALPVTKQQYRNSLTGVVTYDCPSEVISFIFICNTFSRFSLAPFLLICIVKKQFSKLTQAGFSTHVCLFL